MIDKNCNQEIPSSQRVIDRQDRKFDPTKTATTPNHASSTTTTAPTTKNSTMPTQVPNHNPEQPVTDTTSKLSYPSGPGKKLSHQELYPPTPSILVHNEAEVFSPQLQEFCLANPIAAIRNICRVLNLDLSLFSTKTLVDADADHQIEVRTQLQQPSDQNWDLEKKNMIWRCESPRNFCKIAKYASYQANTFQDYLEKTDENNLNDTSINFNSLNHHCYENHHNAYSSVTKNSPPIYPNNNSCQQHHQQTSPRESSDSDSNGSALGPSTSSSSSSSTSTKIFKKSKKNAQFNIVTFGTNVDLSDAKKWQAQLDELDKLPMFSRVVSPSNMLSHVGHSILGMNTVQLYMKVPGCRTPGHQENNNFCSVNINIGPGDCEWFGVPEEYWGRMAKLCAENNTNFVHGSWWPNLDDLYSYNIPVYRFIQKPGDLVWVNTGTVHWVQAIGWCNNIAWNVGPITSKQYLSAIERFEWNKIEKYKSIVPMINLTWNLARNIEIHDESLFIIIKQFMSETLKYCDKILGMLENGNIEVKWHGRAEDEVAHYCINCEIEVFNVLFVKAIEKKLVVHCFKCAIESSRILENFIVLQQYDINELKEIYSQFIKSFDRSRKVFKIPFS